MALFGSHEIKKNIEKNIKMSCNIRHIEWVRSLKGLKERKFNMTKLKFEFF